MATLEKRRYRCRSCAHQHRWADPAYRARLEAKMQHKSDLQRSVASSRMHQLNADPQVRAKTTATLRGRTFCGVRGGNGQLTPEQRSLAEATGFVTEFSIPTGNPSWKSARVDLAHPALKIAIEVDGASHHTKKQRNRDRRKRAMIEVLGWVMLRLWNSQITEDLETVKKTIAAVVAARLSA